MRLCDDEALELAKDAWNSVDKALNLFGFVGHTYEYLHVGNIEKARMR